MIRSLIKKYIVSFICFGITVLILIFQFKFPDLVPNVIQNNIDNTPSEQVGLVPLLKALLSLYNWSGLISFITGIIIAVVKYLRSRGE
jgi:hypothetical protein